MTNLTESPVYETGIYQLETVSPVLGGPPRFNLGEPVTGHANAQAQQLANRTAYLNANKQPLATNLTSFASLTGAADRLPYFTGEGALSLSVLTAAARTFLTASTVEAQRTAMGLGTAAVARLTTSTADLTTGRVIKIGDFGQHAYLGAVGAIDANTLITPGLHIIVDARPSAGVSANFPNLSEIWSLDVIGGQSSSRCYQTARSLSGGIATRLLLDGTWLEWEVSFSSKRSNTITVDTGSIGYGTGSGGTVTQATSKSTEVTLNKPSGQITMSNELLAAGASVQFQLRNNKVATSDTVVTTMCGGGSLISYSLRSYVGTAGSIFFILKNESAVDSSEAYQFNFTIIKGATS